MTLSIIARCVRTGQFGLSAATALPAVGKLLAHASPDAGAVATQARLNPYIGIDGLRLMADGMSAGEALEELKRRDPRVERRQFALIDRSGATAAWTGSGCKHWAGARTEPDFSVQGNRLTGEEVIEASARAFLESDGQPLVDRLLEALAAGVAAGGDRDGERSANIYVVESEEYPLWDMRVDDHADPVAELRRLRRVFAEKLLPSIKKMPTRGDPSGEYGEADV